ncbi:diaminopimelate epimerase [Dyadobacter sp. Leaf189]|uniref:diaminopimelate epimerase n=1 Tax=Dyadobacter sp. Leaf189 TaxID=1736295 RepID=UPI0006FBC15D|nr:diaminopimelate epimerase [Dyadobacter sp. Leaf189]KQS33710.1 diaminopimelate epimerase [Dyadobacter sp. Leaf189]
MTIEFFKYQGTGNDFVMVDDRNLQFPVSKELIASICHRRFGVGADGLILLQNDTAYDFRMVYFNADGGEGSMCGNGGRCVVQFASDLGVFSGKTRFIAIDGEHEATISGDTITLKMSGVKDLERYDAFDFMNTGSPHYVTYVDDVNEADVVGIGSEIRYGSVYGPKGGTNVNFVEIIEENHLSVRTYERGVEDETFSCGTGVTACALSAHLRKGWGSPIKVETIGGTLQVAFTNTDNGEFSDIYLIGPAVKVFSGTLTV